MCPYCRFGWSSAEAPCSIPYVLPAVRAQLGSPPARVLDVGCGNGFIAGQLQAEGFDVMGIDADEEGISVARAAWPDVHFEVLDSESLEEEEAFDFVISTEVIEHLYDPFTFAANCARALKPGGKLIVSTPYHGYLKNLLLSLTDGWDRHHDALRVGGHIKFWSRSTLKRLLVVAGFRNVSFIGAGRAPYIWMSDIAVATKGGEHRVPAAD
jgi:SAM-dependent methyltransferase